MGIVALLLLIAILLWQNIKKATRIKELTKANQVKLRLLSIINHDLRHPIASFISYLQFKAKAPKELTADEVVDFEQKAIEKGKVLLYNIDELLFWCKSQIHECTPQYKVLSVCDLFDDIGIFFGYEERVILSFSSTQELIIRSDENYVKTIMRNLTLNAITASIPKEELNIKWKAVANNGHIIVSITNYGEAITPDQIRVLYDKSHAVDISKGMGLQLIKDLADAIHCKIEVEHTSAGATTFSLIFR
ncbi:MAG: hypothetical protein RL662_2311 [Bacteroidota bacterium]